jgi:hypothetical protein
MGKCQPFKVIEVLYQPAAQRLSASGYLEFFQNILLYYLAVKVVSLYSVCLS